MKNRIAFALLMGVVTTGVISFSLIFLNVGFGARFMAAWTRSWAIAYVIVIPAILLIAPQLQRFVATLFTGPATPGRALRQKIAFALSMGVVTTGIISFAVILFNLGLRDDFVQLWARSWGFAYLIVIPALLIVAPRVQGLVDRMFARAV
jgi:hypothetical protein